VHKRLKGIPILNGDVMGAPVQNGIAGLDKWFSTDIALLKDPWKGKQPEFGMHLFIKRCCQCSLERAGSLFYLCVCVCSCLQLPRGVPCAFESKRSRFALGSFIVVSKCICTLLFANGGVGDANP